MLVAFLLACSTVAVRLMASGQVATSLCGEMDITTVFGTVVPGSSPGGGTKLLKCKQECATI